MSLHLVFTLAGLEHCQKRRHAGEPVVLLGDGVYGISEAIDNCYILQPDAQNRGVTPSVQAPQFIDYETFVQLTIDHHPSVSWTD